MTTKRLFQRDDYVRLNPYSAVFRISHFDELGTQAYLLPAPTVEGGAKTTCSWHPISQLELVEV